MICSHAVYGESILLHVEATQQNCILKSDQTKVVFLVKNGRKSTKFVHSLQSEQCPPDKGHIEVNIRVT